MVRLFTSLRNHTYDQKNIHLSLVICAMTNLNFVTDFDASHCGLLSGHLEQLSIACPNLKRLDLNGNRSCLKCLKGLKSIVNQCHNLQGLNLNRVHVTGVQKCIELWELLSEIKMLSCLTVQSCTMEPFGKNDTCAQHCFLQLVQKFVHLEDLQLSYNERSPCSSCQYASCEAYPQLLAHFPVLVYCHVISKPLNVADIITNCKRLKYFGFYHYVFSSNWFFPSLLTVAPNQYLQDLHIVSQGSDIGEIFMDSVLAHGKLERVFLLIQSVMVAGITALVQNSPKLYFCEISYQQIFDNQNVEVDSNIFKDTLKNKFLCRKLFYLDGFKLVGDNHVTFYKDVIK